MRTGIAAALIAGLVGAVAPAIDRQGAWPGAWPVPASAPGAAAEPHGSSDASIDRLATDLAPARAASPAGDPDSGDEMLGRPAPPWSFDRWLRTAPLTPAGLRGKVVLLRWWTEGCRFCETTLPAIEALRRDAGRGDLVVIGVYHPKPPRRVADRRILAAAERLGFDGPIAVDAKWATLERYWLDGDPGRSWTSVSFLIGRDGTVRWVHGGGEYHESADPLHARCDLQHRGLARALAAALAEGRTVAAP